MADRIFVSKSEQRRAAFQTGNRKQFNQITKKFASCVHFIAEIPYRSNQQPCGKPVHVGHLCKEHHDEHERIMCQRRGQAQYVDQDPHVIQGILDTEAKAIAEGKRTRVRFGALEPVYLHYWEPRPLV